MPDGIELPISSASAPRYRYYTVNIVTNKVIGEIPFEDVNYERSVKSPGAFDGKITVTDQTDNLDLYNATLPGKTALYVVRNDEAVWGGIIWGRTYDLVGRSLTISASEFTSYLSHRIVWKTYSHSFTAKLSKTSDDGYTKVSLINKSLKAALPLTDASGNPTVVTINFTDNNLRKYNGDYKVKGLASSTPAPADPGRTAFYVELPLLPPKVGVYDGVGVTMKSDTYDYLRDIITSTLSDFTEIEFPNEVIEPGIKEAITVSSKQLAYTNTIYGVATLTTSTEHGLTLGQRVEIANVDPMLDGIQAVSEIPNKFAFKYVLNNPVSAYDRTTKIYLSNTLSNVTTVSDTRDEISYRQVDTAIPQQITQISRTNGVVTLTFDGIHNFEKGQKIILTIANTAQTTWKVSTTTTKNGVKTTKKVNTNSFDYKKWNYTVQVTSAEDETITYDDPKWKSSTYNKTFLIDPAQLANNTAKTAEPVATLKLYPKKSSGYNIGDNIYVDGVDQPQWPYELYDGYQKIYDVSPGPVIGVTSYKVFLEDINDDEEGATTIATYVVNKDPKIKNGDEFEVQGITAYPQMNGKYKAVTASASWSPVITSAVGNGSAIVYTIASNPIEPVIGQLVTVTGTKKVSGSSANLDVANAAVTAANATSFTVASSKSANTTGGVVTSLAGPWTVKTKKVSITWTANVASAVSNGSAIVYTVSTTPSAPFQPVVGQLVTVTGATALNISNAAVTAANATTFTVASNVASTTATGGSALFGNLNQSSGATLQKNGDSWIAFRPNTSELRYSLKSEPDNVATISKLAYNKTSKIVTLTTAEAHNFRIGDKVKVSFAKSTGARKDDQKTFGGWVTITGVSDLDSVSYKLIKGEHKLSAPTTSVAEVNKAGTITASLSSTAPTASIDIPIQGIRAEPTGDSYSTVTVYSTDNDLKVGDYVSTSFVDPVDYTSDNYSGFSSMEEPVKVTEAATNYFRYVVGGPTFTSDSSDIYDLTYISDSNVRITIGKSVAYTSVTANVASVDFSQAENNQITMTTTANHGIVKGQKVTLSGFPLPTTSNRSSSNTAATIDNISFRALDKAATITFTSPHGLDVDGLEDIGSKIRISNAATSVDYASGETDFPAGLPLASWINRDHYITAVPTEDSVIIPIMDFQENWVINASGLTEIVGNTYILRDAKTIYTPDYSKLNFTADVASVPASDKLVFKFPDVDGTGFPGTYTPTANTVKVYAPAYRNSLNNQPIVGDIFQLSGFRIKDNIDYSYLNLDGYTVVATGAHPTESSTKMYVYLQNPKVGKTRPKYSAQTFTGVFPKFNRALPAAGNANLSQAPRDVTESRNLYTINKVTRDIANNKATVYVVGTHNILKDDLVAVDMFKNNFDLFSQNTQSVKATAVTANSVTYTLPVATTVDATAYSGGIVTLYFVGGASGGHGWFPGDTVTVPSISGPGNKEYGNNTFTILSVSPTSISYPKASLTNHKKTGYRSQYALTRASSVSITDNIAYGILSKVPTIYKRPVVYSKTYGEYPNNANIGGITFSTNDYSNKNMPNSPIYGSDLQTVAEILDKYSNGLNGFDYRIDPGLSYDQNGVRQFTRKFVLMPIYPKSLTDYMTTLPGGKLARGQVATPAALGANKVIFEYPGNITNVSMAEKAETSATRIFVRSGDGKAGSGTEVAYSGAADVDLLQDNWPLLDKKESVTWPLKGAENSAATSSPTNTDDWGNHDDETDYHKSALRFLKESKPPAGDFNIDVNGSITPVIGSYNPGDWCSIIINDNFVKTRLDSVLEPRKDVIVRKIDSIKVAVPNNPAFPEKITLNLITDWQVDAVGK